MPTEVLLFLLGSVFTIGFIFYLYFSSRHRERMAIIEKGGNIEFPSKRNSGSSSLKWGLTMVSLGLALGIGITLDISNNNDGPFFTFPLLLIGGGIGQLIYHRMKKQLEDTV